MSGGGRFKEGTYVRHTGVAKWGLGKILRVRGDRVDAYFKGDLEVHTLKADTAALVVSADVASDPLLDSLPPFEEDAKGALRPPAPPKGKSRLTLAQAKQKLLDHFPLGFADPKYEGDRSTGERGYKWERHELFVKLLGGGRGDQLLADGELAELQSCVERIVSKKFNLLDYRFEAPIFLDALAPSEAARKYYQALFALLAEPVPDERSFALYVDAALGLPHKKSPVATWPIVTLLPYLAQPDRHMLLRVTPTKDAASILTFDLQFESKLQWRTYRRLLQLAEVLLAELAPLPALPSSSPTRRSSYARSSSSRRSSPTTRAGAGNCSPGSSTTARSAAR